jgi:dTDP-4-dehydrorhamnose 3,5-epimerase
MYEPFLIDLKTYSDNRGCFAEKYNSEIQNKLNIIWTQENFSFSSKNVLRGLHYQLNSPQAKLIHCINGKILDIIVDIRCKSNNYGKHYKYFLKYDQMLFVPEGFAHGFVSLVDNTIVEYKCSNIYKPNDSYTISWNDKYLNIDWATTHPILSQKDAAGLTFEEAPKFI